MGHLPAPETDDHLDAVPCFQETPGISDLDVEIVLLGRQLQLHFLDIDGLLVALGFALLLLLFKDELAVIHDLTDRIIGRRRNQDQVEIGFMGPSLGLLNRNDANHIPLFIDQPYAGETNALVNGVGSACLSYIGPPLRQ